MSDDTLSYLQRRCIDILVENPQWLLTKVNPDLHDHVYKAIGKSKRLYRLTHCESLIKRTPMLVTRCNQKLPCGKHIKGKRRCTFVKSNGKQCNNDTFCYYWRDSLCSYHHEGQKNHDNRRRCFRVGCQKRGVLLDRQRNKCYCLEHAQNRCTRHSITTDKRCRRRSAPGREFCRCHELAPTDEHEFQCTVLLKDGVQRCPYLVPPEQRSSRLGIQQQYCYDHALQMVRRKKIQPIIL